MNILLIVLLVMFPLVALAQGDMESLVAGGVPIGALLAALIPVAAGLLSTQFGSNNLFMRIVDVFAFNWGKARNDSSLQ